MLIVAVAADALRPPRDQISARAYAGLVGIYQSHISPGLRSYIQCRYQPTCSEYSRQAVERHGIARGLVLSGRRAFSCRESVPPGTPDPVP
jgi:hypothetical protein